MHITREFQQFLRGYVAALLWSSNDADPVTGDMRDLDEYELSTAGADKCRADCLAFFTANRADIALTRNGHGAGYWDGDLPKELGDRLTAAAKAAGEVWPYLGDDGEVYIQ